MANAESPTHAREGNVHHGNAAQRRFPMMSHLGQMLPVVVGGTWGASGEDPAVRGLAVIGDGGTSTGEFHEALNLASVFRTPVLFVIENNHLAFSTPTSAQYHCRRLSDRAAGYAMPGKTIDGTDFAQVYTAVWDALEANAAGARPVFARVPDRAAPRPCGLRQGRICDRRRTPPVGGADPLPRTRRNCGKRPAAKKTRSRCGKPTRRSRLKGRSVGRCESGESETVWTGRTRSPSLAPPRCLGSRRNLRRTARRCGWPWITSCRTNRGPTWPAWTSAGTDRRSRPARG